MIPELPTRAGRSTRELAGRRYKASVRFILPMLGVVLLISAILLYNSRSYSKLGLVGGAVFLGVALLIRSLMDFTNFRERKMIREEKRATRGAEGEEAIGSILDSLGDDYLVIHDVVSQYGNIDHIVIAKHGSLFLLETKAHGGRVSVANGRVLVNGHEPEKDFIRQALNNTFWLRDRVREATGLEIWITPVLVFVNAFVEQAPPIKGVRILNQKYLARVLQQPDRRQRIPVLWENRKKIESILSRALPGHFHVSGILETSK
jgi:hypothetical protein